MKKRILIIASIVLVMIGLMAGFVGWYVSPRVAFERKFYFSLPKSIKIINYSYDLYWDSLSLKVQFSAENYEMIHNGFKRFTEIHGGGEVSQKGSMFDEELAYFEGERFVRAYESNEPRLHDGGDGTRVRFIRMLITQSKDNPEQYFLDVLY